jgi:hypothetical protein
LTVQCTSFITFICDLFFGGGGVGIGKPGKSKLEYHK